MTVCQDSDVPTDPMAPIARYLMPLKYDCGKEPPHITFDGIVNCGNDSDLLRRQFDFLFEAAFDLVEQKVLDIFNIAAEGQKIPPKLQNTIDTKGRLLIDPILSLNITTTKKLRNLIKKLFARASSREFFAFLERILAGSKIEAKAPSLEARKISALATFSLRDIGSFGHFVTEVLPLVQPVHFSRMKIGRQIAVTGHEFMAMHDLFRNITRALNSLTPMSTKPDHLDSVSVFEIPDRLSLKSAKHLRVQVYSEQPWYLYKDQPDQLCDYTDCFKYLKKYLTDISSFRFHPCTKNRTGSCCDDNDILQGDYHTIMKVMRLAKHRSRDLVGLEEIVNVASTLGYSYHKLGEGPTYVDRKYFPQGKDPFTMIPFNEFGSQENNIGNRFDDPGKKTWNSLFQPVITDNGVCHGFNSPPIEELFKPSPFLKAFRSAFQEDLLHDSLFRAEPYSNDLGLYFALDKQMVFKNFWNGTKEGLEGSFRISFTEPMASVSIRSKLRSVHLGYHVTFELTPHVLISESDLRYLPSENRHCLFHDELPKQQSVSSRYSQGGCIFECVSQIAQNVCSCFAWDIPPAGNSNALPICNSYGYFCFDDIVRNSSYQSLYCNHCLPDCDVVEYQITETMVPLDANKLCRTQEVKYRTLSLHFLF